MFTTGQESETVTRVSLLVQIFCGRRLLHNLSQKVIGPPRRQKLSSVLRTSLWNLLSWHTQILETDASDNGLSREQDGRRSTLDSWVIVTPGVPCNRTRDPSCGGL
jgi:hypothetical protein